MDEYGGANSRRSGRGWMLACCGMLLVLLVTVAGWGAALARQNSLPLCWLSLENAPLTAREAEPPEGEELYGWNGFYEIDYALRNEGEQTLFLYNYELAYDAAGRGGYAWVWSAYPGPALEPVRVLPAGQTIRFTQLVSVSGNASPEDAFPLTVRLEKYDVSFALGSVEAPAG